ncbi:NEP1-interacting protein 2-like [Ananas comosus]|uniref:NEP1-interacting protein 2-like n=1 Tax=Ananas comosus TaxID=4615 RepID=A0A6P5FES8_ANACO|nr:NEP1-interacting protein 2-like [Ananas comosus]
MDFSTNYLKWVVRETWKYGFMAYGMIGTVICVVATCFFAIVGSIVGAVTGAVIGSGTESGMLRGAGVGAISGAVFSIEAVESSRDRWNSNGLGVWSILYLMDIIYSLLSGRLVREKVDPAMQSAVSSQISAISSPFVESTDFFDTGFVSGMPKDSIEELPKVKITKEDMVDKTGENICCSVCLQDLQIGDLARKLPNCVHMFHSRCIDSWLIRHGSCPLCRRDV